MESLRAESAPGNTPGGPAPLRPDSAPDPRVVTNCNTGADASDDWTLNPGPASTWPYWTDLARYELGPEPADQVGEGVAGA